MSKEEMEEIYEGIEVTEKGEDGKMKINVAGVKKKAKQILPYVATGAVLYFGGKYLYGKIDRLEALETLELEIETGE